MGVMVIDTISLLVEGQLRFCFFMIQCGEVVCLEHSPGCLSMLTLNRAGAVTKSDIPASRGRQKMEWETGTKCLPRDGEGRKETPIPPKLGTFVREGSLWWVQRSI